MIRRHITTFAYLSLLGWMTLTGQAALAADALTLETEEIQAKPGFLDEKLGTRVDKVEAAEDRVKISITLPERLTNKDIEEIVVLGKRPQTSEARPILPQIQRFEVVNDLKKGRSGIVIYLKNQENFVLKFNYSEPKSDVNIDYRK